MNTPWTTSDLWLRRDVDLTTSSFSNPHLRVFHDDDAEVYINGDLVATLPGANGAYEFVPLGEQARALRAGRNTIAVHVHNTRGAQFIDLGLVDVIDK